VRGILENAIYGGHLDNALDGQKLHAMLKMYFSEDVYTVNGRNPMKRLAKNISTYLEPFSYSSVA
jgi:hypothetical protein